MKTSSVLVCRSRRNFILLDIFLEWFYFKVDLRFKEILHYFIKFSICLKIPKTHWKPAIFALVKNHLKFCTNTKNILNYNVDSISWLGTILLLIICKTFKWLQKILMICETRTIAWKKKPTGTTKECCVLFSTNPGNSTLQTEIVRLYTHPKKRKTC